MGDPDDDRKLSEATGGDTLSQSSNPSSVPTGGRRGEALRRIQVGSGSTNGHEVRRNLRGSGQPLLEPLGSRVLQRRSQFGGAVAKQASDVSVVKEVRGDGWS